MKIGYARVSTRRQNLDLQMRALRTAGCDIVFTDQASGVSAVRKGLARALARCGDGDQLVVWRLDRLGRDLFDLLKVNQLLVERGASLTVLTGVAAGIDTGSAEGRIIFTMLAALAEYERAMLGERINAGLQAARERGTRFGRPRGRRKHQISCPALTPVWRACAG